MNLRKVIEILVRISRFVLAALFLFTAGAKLAILKTFAGNVAELLSSASINYERWRWPVTIGVIAVEVIVAGLLIIPRAVRVGAALAALFLIGFRGFAPCFGYVLPRQAPKCGCFVGTL